ncbi:MAG: hypothetical protein ACYCZX_04890 [Rhodospirillaceae bacterium]
MGSMISAEFEDRPTPYETKVRSTALAHRFMVRRSLAQFRAAVPTLEGQKPSPARALVRTLKTQTPPT